ncbi:response regulator [Tunicatimonas pelagia]|uniref:response regulator n=1 Tax=Tunicatimonas pelagia TaxID=931531 RepID=UPI002665E9F1|nr:response regulator transcription factor [Tunicatimonas pelagia]WKN40977.1 response regulator transcription factor [Tunicatimonas pelagia]
MNKITVVLVDDHAILTEGTASILKEYDFIDLVGAVNDGQQAFKLVVEHKPDVLVADISMPGISIFDIIQEIEKKQLPTKVLILSMHDSPNYVFKALNNGVNGYITKYADREEMVKAIQTVAQGDEYYSQTITQVIVKGFKEKKSQESNDQNPINVLSKREKEVLTLLVEGLNSKQIAERLFLSERTVSNHRANMLQKCQVNNTVELVRLYLDNVNKW